MCLNTSLELQQIGCSQARYVGRGICLEWLPPLGKTSTSLGNSVNDLYRDIVSHKSHVTELKNWMPKH